jgi:hypothetical protein
MTVIDWSSPSAKITENFTVREACFLPSWGILHRANAKERENLIKVCELLEKVRAAVNAPIVVHCMIRPPKVNAPGSKWNKQDYNAAVQGAAGSAHRDGLAVDFHVPGTNCDDLRTFLLPFLESWDCRMERAEGTDWVHLDLRPVPPRGNRYFKP